MKLGLDCYPVSFNADPSIAYLNLNINSHSADKYKFYPTLKNPLLAKEYLELLHRLTDCPKDTLNLVEDNVLFTQGSVEAIDLIIRAFCEPGQDSILITSPTFSYYAYRAAIENVLVEDVPLEGEDLNLLNKEELLQRNAKVLFLNTPNNPVGTALNGADIEDLIKRFQGIVVVDEAYIEWTDHSTAAQWLEKYDNLIVLRTFSKIWGLAGVRCGIVLAQKSIIDLLSLLQPLFSFPQSSADLVSRKLKEIECISEYRSKMSVFRKDFFDFLSTNRHVEKVYPGVANFLFVEFKDAAVIQKHLFDAKILVSNTTQHVTRTLRISIGTEEEMQRLKNVLMDIKS